MADGELQAALADGYGFEERSITFGRPLAGDLGSTVNTVTVRAPLTSLNKHGLIAGATGTGKTTSLQVMAEELSAAGVPVFLADLKGDLTGLAIPSGGHPKIDQRMAGMDLPWAAESFPVELLSISGDIGSALRVPVVEFGPLLLAKVMDCSDTQASVLSVLFKFADEQGLALVDLVDLVDVIKYLTSDEGKQVQAAYGGMATSTLNVLLRKAMELETQGAERFFGEPVFDVDDLTRTRDGRGVISIMNLTDMRDRPKIFSTFMMWLLAELYETAPEVGDPDQPVLAFFFDEAHLLFDDASEAMLDAVEMTVRMIRSKGIGVFFVTQNPTDLPDGVLAQLGNRVQHALRAFTPNDKKALADTADTFPTTDHYDVRATLQGLGTGEALITVLDPDGSPTPTVATRMVAPRSTMDPVDGEQTQQVAAQGDLGDKYAEELDRESAREVLAARLERTAPAGPDADMPDADTPGDGAPEPPASEPPASEPPASEPPASEPEPGPSPSRASRGCRHPAGAPSRTSPRRSPRTATRPWSAAVSRCCVACSARADAGDEAPRPRRRAGRGDLGGRLPRRVDAVGLGHGRCRGRLGPAGGGRPGGGCAAPLRPSSARTHGATLTPARSRRGRRAAGRRPPPPDAVVRWWAASPTHSVRGTGTTSVPREPP